MEYFHKYTVEYSNIAEDVFRLEIFKLQEFAPSQEITLQGSVTYNKKPIKDSFEPLRATSLGIDLEASVENVLPDFNGFEEFDFKVKFYRNDLQIFEGWINPDGYFQDWVNDKWVISMTAVDGIGGLKNLEFSDEDNVEILGSPVEFKYAPREFNYLHAILRRLGYTLPYTIGDDINVNLGVPVDWVDYDKRIIDATVFTNENGNKLDCETVLKDILQKYNLFITQNNIDGRLVWHICRVPYWGLATTARRNRQYTTDYDTSAGSASVEVELTQFAFADGIPEIKTIYSDINSNIVDPPPPIHCNENQQITYNPALQNFRFESKWLGERNFYNEMESWTEIPPLPVGFFLTDDYIRMYNVWEPLLINDPWFQAESVRQPSTDVFSIRLLVNWWVDYQFMNPATTIPDETKLRFLLQSDVGGTIYYYNQVDDIWQDTPVYFEVLCKFPSGINTIGIVEGITEIILPVSGGNVYDLFVYSPYSLAEVEHEVRIYNVEFYFVTSQFGIGKTHDATQPEKRSTYLEDPVTIINSNEPNAYFTNNIYRLAKPPETITGLVPMNEWKATGTPEYDDLLELTSRERVKAKQKPQLNFRGDVFGYLPYVSIIKFDGIAGNYMALSYNYNTALNTIEVEATQVFSDEATINHEKNYIFEEERNALIKT